VKFGRLIFASLSPLTIQHKYKKQVHNVLLKEKAIEKIVTFAIKKILFFCVA
jgi:hypothetical protein